MLPRSNLAYDEVARRLRESILGGTLAAGDRLPTEAELCSRFGVSRSTVREALRLLGSQKLVTTTRGVSGGTFVAHLDPADVTEMLHDSIRMLAQTHGCTISELLETRTLLEVTGASLAAERRNPAQLDALRASVRGGVSAIPARQIIALNRAFHHGILEATGNRLLHLLTEPVFVVIDSIHPAEGYHNEYWELVMQDHADIFAAIEARDSVEAGRRMQDHLTKTHQFMPRDEPIPPRSATGRKTMEPRVPKTAQRGSRPRHQDKHPRPEAPELSAGG